MLDFDGDGDEDLFFVDAGPLPGYKGEAPRSRLFRNDGNGHFTDWTEKSGIKLAYYGGGAAAGDVDGDGDLDLFVTGLGGVQLFRNNGDGTFTDVTRESGIADPFWSSSAAFADVDNDGDLDLLVVNYVDFSFANNPLCGDVKRKLRGYCHPDIYHGQPVQLFRNKGNGTFEDASQAAGLAGIAGPGLARLLRRHRQRRLAGLLRRQRQQAELPPPQQGERHLRGHLGPLRHRDRRAGAPGGGDGDRHGGLRRRRPARHRGHQLRAGDQRPLPEPRRRHLRRQPLAGRHRRAVAAVPRASASPSPISIRTAISTW